MKKKVALLGVTGRVGQTLLYLLDKHPLFELVQVSSSPSKIGLSLEEATQDHLEFPLSLEHKEMKLSSYDEEHGAELYLSALKREAAIEIEGSLRKKGKRIVSNAGAYRNEPDVPIFVPEINASHLELLNRQIKRFGGFIVCQSNCCASPLSLALYPLLKWGVEQVNVVTLQAISGAGKSLKWEQIEDNILPWIDDEEEKIQKETLQILGKIPSEENRLAIEPYPAKIIAQVNRVPVSHGHTLCLSVKLKNKFELDEVLSTYQELKKQGHSTWQLNLSPEGGELRSAREVHGGMAITLSRIEALSSHELKMVVMSHNMIRGAAGGSLYAAECLFNEGWI